MRDATIIHESTWKAIKRLSTIEQQYETLKLLLDYGIYDIKPETQDSIVHIVLDMALPNINAAALRYDKSITNGTKGAEYGVLGGRPQKFTNADLLSYQQKGFTQKQMAEVLGVDVRTIRRRLTEISQEDKTPSKPLDIDIKKESDIETNIENEEEVDGNIDLYADIEKYIEYNQREGEAYVCNDVIVDGENFKSLPVTEYLKNKI